MRFFIVLISCVLVGCDHGDSGKQIEVKGHVKTPSDDKRETKVVPPKIKIVETTEDAFKDWWDIRSTQPSYLTVEFTYVKKLKTRPRPVTHIGKLAFFRKDRQSNILIRKYKKNARREKIELVNGVLVTEKKYIEYTASTNQTKETNLNDPSNQQAKEMLTTLMIYGRSKSELLKNFHVREFVKPNAKGEWQFKLIPKDAMTRKNIPAIQINMKKATFTFITFFEDSMFGGFDGEKVTGSKQYFQFKFNKAFDYKTTHTSESLKKAINQ